MGSKVQMAVAPDRCVHSVETLPEDEDHLIPARDLPRYTAVARQTYARWRHEGNGPKYTRLGGRVFYRAGDVRQWIRGQVRQNTIQK